MPSIQRRPVTTKAAPPPAGAYSQGVISNGFLFISGQGPFDENGNKCPASFSEEAHLAFKNLQSVAAAAGAELSNAVRVGVYLDDMANFVELSEIMREYFREPLPARTTIPVALNGFQIEVDVIVAM